MWLVWCLASEENQAAKAEQHYQEIVQKRKLEDFARAQEDDLALLCTELEHLWMSNFPLLNEL